MNDPVRVDFGFSNTSIGCGGAAPVALCPTAEFRMIRWICVSIGGISLVLGAIGIFLPVLPTTPFLILAAFCFSQGSPRFHTWLVNHRWFGPPIRNWEQHRAIRTRHKILATLMLCGSLSLVFLKDGIPLAAGIGFAVLAAGILSYIWTRKGGDSF